MAKSTRQVSSERKFQRVFTIPPSVSFLDELVQSLVDGRLIPNFKLEQDWSVLSDVTIYVPTRRSARTLAELFRSYAHNNVTFLPKIRPLGDIDETYHITESLADASELPPEMSHTERHLALTRLILGWIKSSTQQLNQHNFTDDQILSASPTDAAWLARELILLMDQIESEDANWSQLSKLVPEEHAKYWQLTIEFLQIAFDVWPSFLAEQGKMDPVARNSALIHNEADLLARFGSKGPIIVAGSTGTVSATRKLLKTIAELPNGAVVLPGLDLFLDDKSWNLLTESGANSGVKRLTKHNDSNPGHPQFGLAKLIRHLGITRKDIVSLCPPASTNLEVREQVVSEAMKPVITTDSWINFQRKPANLDLNLAFEDCALIEAKNEIEEGLAIALVLREAIENGNKATLVLTDQTLARRVASELERWSIQIFHSTGQYLKETPPTVLARLITKLALHRLDAVTVLSLLKHPITRIGMNQAELRLAISALERGILRGPQSDEGFSGLQRAIANSKKMQQEQSHIPKWQRLSASEWQTVEEVIVRLENALSPLINLKEQGDEISINELARRTLHSLQLVGTDNNGDDFQLFSWESTDDLVKFLKSLIDDNKSGLEILPANWPELFESLLVNISTLDTRNAETRVDIYTPLESRLHRPDIIILGGLSEGSWPRIIRNDPWLNRPMKSGMGLEQPERRIGLSAHDFCQSLGTQRVIMTRSLRADGSPTVASRWLQRLLTVSGDSIAELLRKNGLKYIDWAQQLDSSSEIPKPVTRPCPKPPISSRPKQLSITEIETWVRDPYAIYARKILQLEPIDMIGGSPGAAERGSIIHDCLAEFLRDWDGPFNDLAIERLIEIGAAKFETLSVFPQLYALWWPRFQRIARWFVNNFELERAKSLQQRYLECSGVMEVRIERELFKLVGRADRIDLLNDGSLSILDYKTGQIPSLRQVETLLAPQLPLEVAMVKSGGFQGIAKECEIRDQTYVILSGGKKAGDVQDRSPKNVSVVELANQASQSLQNLVRAYFEHEQGYLSRARVFKERIFSGPYDHLARVQEWSVGIVDEDEL